MSDQPPKYKSIEDMRQKIFASKRRKHKQYIHLHEYLMYWDMIRATQAELAKNKDKTC
jgi:hypothetical protein